MRKWRWMGVLVLGLGVAFLAVYLKLRPDPNDFALLGPTPFPLEVIPRSTMFEKPVISTKLPLIGKIEIPARPVPPKEFVDGPLISGILTPKQTGTPKDIEAQFWLQAFDKFDFGDGTKREMTRLPEPLSSSAPAMSYIFPNHVSCPYVFGQKSEEVKFVPLEGSSSPLTKMGPIKVRLPALGVPEPVMSDQVMKVGHWTATITPKRWRSPAFKLYIDVKINGGDPSETLFVGIESGSWPFPDGFQIKSGETIPLEWEDWGTRETLKISIHAGVPKQREVIIKTTMSPYPPSKNYAVKWKEGSTLFEWIAMSGGGHSGEEHPLDPYFAVKIKDWWIGPFRYFKVGEDQFSMSDFRSWWNGLVMKATCYRSVRSAKGEAVLPWPGSASFRKLKPR